MSRRCRFTTDSCKECEVSGEPPPHPPQMTTSWFRSPSENSFKGADRIRGPKKKKKEPRSEAATFLLSVCSHKLFSTSHLFAGNLGRLSQHSGEEQGGPSSSRCLTQSCRSLPIVAYILLGVLSTVKRAPGKTYFHAAALLAAGVWLTGCSLAARWLFHRWR